MPERWRFEKGLIGAAKYTLSLLERYVVSYPLHRQRGLRQGLGTTSVDLKSKFQWRRPLTWAGLEGSSAFELGRRYYQGRAGKRSTGDEGLGLMRIQYIPEGCAPRACVLVVRGVCLFFGKRSPFCTGSPSPASARLAGPGDEMKASTHQLCPTRGTRRGVRSDKFFFSDGNFPVNIQRAVGMTRHFTHVSPSHREGTRWMLVTCTYNM